MLEDQAIQRIRLQLLALVLAIALTWYALNPAPGPSSYAGHMEEHPDEKRREEKSPARMSYDPGKREAFVLKSASHTVDKNIEDLEWPEVIDAG